MVKIFSAIHKQFLNLIAWLLKLSRHNIYYLVDKPLRTEIQEVSQSVFAYQHIDNAIWLAQNRFRTEGGAVIADVGGGTATTATLFSKHLPQHDIYVFEPIKTNFQEIEKASARTNRWQLINKAVGSQAGTTEINIAERITASSLLEMDGNTEGYYGDILKTQRRETIEITTLDAALPADKPVDILKMDVQGFELEVLKGANQTLKRTKVIVLEVNNHDGYKGAPTYFEIDAFLRLYGFELFDLLPNYREAGKLLDWDAIYVNKSLLK
ncbi:MAG: FkbM family methyltransferase [Saprospiraceae bacterium]|nr:FkbM family methyltransferase [Saprospiraceae bacterium]